MHRLSTQRKPIGRRHRQWAGGRVGARNRHGGPRKGTSEAKRKNRHRRRRRRCRGCPQTRAHGAVACTCRRRDGVSAEHRSGNGGGEPTPGAAGRTVKDRVVCVTDPIVRAAASPPKPPPTISRASVSGDVSRARSGLPARFCNSLASETNPLVALRDVAPVAFGMLRGEGRGASQSERSETAVSLRVQRGNRAVESAAGSLTDRPDGHVASRLTDWMIRGRRVWPRERGCGRGVARCSATTGLRFGRRDVRARSLRQRWRMPRRTAAASRPFRGIRGARALVGRVVRAIFAVLCSLTGVFPVP